MMMKMKLKSLYDGLKVSSRTLLNIVVVVCLSVGLSVPCPTPPAADKSLSLMHKTSPTTGQAVYKTDNQ